MLMFLAFNVTQGTFLMKSWSLLLVRYCFSFLVNRISRYASLFYQIFSFYWVSAMWLNDFVCVPVVNVEEAVDSSLLFLLICTVDIKHIMNGGEEIIAPRPHSAWLYMDNFPPENKKNVYLRHLHFFNLSKIMSCRAVTHALVRISLVHVHSFILLHLFYFCKHTVACNWKHLSCGAHKEV